MEIRLAELKGQHSLLKSRQYSSGLSQLMNELEIELQALRQEWSRLDKLMHSITPGSTCPSCLQKISNEHVSQVKSEIQKQKDALKVSAQPLTSRRKWLKSQDEEARKNFEARIAEDIKVCEDEITKLLKELHLMKAENNEIIKNFSDKKQQTVDKLKETLTAIDRQIQETNNNYNTQLLSYEETVASKKVALLKEIDELQASRHAQTEAENASIEIARLSSLLESVAAQVDVLNRKITAAMEYAAKRAELTLKPLKMNRVEIKLQDVVRSTGEIVNTFRFTYDGRDYRILSLSERIKAGLEVSNLIQQLTGRSYPVLVDNSESIADIDTLDIQGQAIFTRVVPGERLSVKSLSAGEMTLLPVRKAG